MTNKETLDMEAENTIQSKDYSLYGDEVLQSLNESKLNTPFSKHGKLSLKGADIVDKNGEKFQLKGVCPVMYMEYSAFANKELIKSLRDNRGCNVIRLALYTETLPQNGAKAYCQNDTEKHRLKKAIKDSIEACKELGMYVIIDWHILRDYSPLFHNKEAKEFFEDISKTFKDYDNVIYEICNEPNGTPWKDIKKYSDTIIPIIRENNKDAIIIVGTPNWSQEANIKEEDRIKGKNIMYAFHFYAATHKGRHRKKLLDALESGVPVFITEFGICEGTGDGKIDVEEAEKWFKIIDDYNLSYCTWNFSEYGTTSSILKPSPVFDKLKENEKDLTNDKSEPFNITITEDMLTENGKIILNHFKGDN